MSGWRSKMLIIVKRKPGSSAQNAGQRSFFYPFLGLATALVGLFSPLIAAHAGPQGPRCRVPLCTVAQNEDESQGDESEVATSDIDKYVAVYKAMQRDRSLSVEQAANTQGMTLKAFRDLENRIERDESAREHARHALRAAASSDTSSDHPIATPSQRSQP
jgi:hypothetical protein